MKRTVPLRAVVALCAAAGCSDPADKVHQSAANEPAAAAPAPTPEASAAPAAAPAAVVAPASAVRTCVIRAESTVGFIGSKVTGSHNGGFRNFAGALTVENGRITGAPEIKINLKSLWTDNDRLTRHLQSADFFDVEKFPVATFTVTAIEGSGVTNKVTGNLNLHGVTRTISFPAAVQVTDEAVTVKAAFAINRRQWNINYPGRPNDLIRDNVVVKLDLKATPGPPRPGDQLAN
jgi:polyisoprenoid-binding protein YceI